MKKSTKDNLMPRALFALRCLYAAEQLGEPLSYAKLGKAMGVSPTSSSVANHVHRLEKLGFVKSQAYIRCSVRVTEQGKAYLEKAGHV